MRTYIILIVWRSKHIGNKLICLTRKFDIILYDEYTPFDCFH